MNEVRQLKTFPGGYGPPFEVTDLPDPPLHLAPRKLLAILGPAVIALGGTLGGGEWLVGPSLFVKWGLALLWITTCSSTLQVFLNLEMIRYTLYAGEPITVGFMRLWPGKAFWGWFYTVIGFLERAMPGWAMGAATALAAAQLGRIPEGSDKGMVVIWTYILFASCVVLVFLGRKMERTLEWANWLMMFVVLGGLLLLDIYVVPASVWWEGLKGFVSFGYTPKGIDVLLLGALVGYSAYGGFGNSAITNWYRDKGYGMGQKIGYIPAAIGGKVVHVSPAGKVPLPTEKNLYSWKGWWKLVDIGQFGVFWFGAMAGMFFPGILYVGVLPRGMTLSSWGIAASSAGGLIPKMGNVGWFLALFFGFWILYSTTISNVDLVARQGTDMVWFASERVRKWAKVDIRRIYYFFLAVFMVWGCLFVNIAAPLVILAISANIANLTIAVSAILTIRLNRKFLPKEYRPSWWREAILIFNLLFFGFFFAAFVAWVMMPKIFAVLARGG